MVDFSLISNEKLRLLATTSPAIATLDDFEKQEMVSRFQNANADDQLLYISTLENEQQDLQETNKRWSKDLAQAAATIDETMQDMKHIESDVLKFEETRSQEDDDKHAEEILLQLRSL